MPRVGAPVISPDGLYVVFPMLEPSYKKEEEVADLWLVPTDGREPPRRITSGKGGEADPAWSDDSRQLAFSAKRGDDKQTQIYVIDLARGGEAQRATAYPPAQRLLAFRRMARACCLSARSTPRAATTPTASAWPRKKRSGSSRRVSTPRIRYATGTSGSTASRLICSCSALASRTRRDLLAGTELIKMPGFDWTKDSARWTPDGRPWSSPPAGTATARPGRSPMTICGRFRSMAASRSA